MREFSMQTKFIVSLFASHCYVLIARWIIRDITWPNPGPSMEQSNWLILVIGPLGASVVQVELLYH